MRRTTTTEMMMMTMTMMMMMTVQAVASGVGYCSGERAGMLMPTGGPWSTHHDSVGDDNCKNDDDDDDDDDIVVGLSVQAVAAGDGHQSGQRSAGMGC
jgi:hypothetical protein